MLGTAFQMSMSDIAAKLMTYSSAGPGKDKVMFYPAKADGTLISNKSTANGYGHWFNAKCNVSDYGSGFVYSEMTPSPLSFTIGQYPMDWIDAGVAWLGSWVEDNTADGPLRSMLVDGVVGGDTQCAVVGTEGDNLCVGISEDGVEFRPHVLRLNILVELYHEVTSTCEVDRL